jgi:hypothetical protein
VAITLVTAAFVVGVVYLLIRWSGLPAWVPDWMLEVVPVALPLG